MTATFPRRTVTIDDRSEPGSWAAAIADRVNGPSLSTGDDLNGRSTSQRGQAPADIPPSKKPTNQHGKTS